MPRPLFVPTENQDSDSMPGRTIRPLTPRVELAAQATVETRCIYNEAVMHSGADRLLIVPASDLETQFSTFDGDQFDFCRHLHPDGCRGNMIDTDMQAHGFLLRRKKRLKRSHTGPLRETDQIRSSEDGRHLGKARKDCIHTGHCDVRFDLHGLLMDQSNFQLPEIHEILHQIEPAA